MTQKGGLPLKKRIVSRTSILFRYIFSYVSIVLLCCSALISFSILSTTSQLNDELQKQQHYQLSLISEEMERIYKEMNDIALDIAVSSTFKPFLFRRNVYYEIEIVEALNKYQNRTLLDEGLFLIYDGQDCVFTANAKGKITTYFQYLLKVDDPQALLSRLWTCQSFSILQDENFQKDLQLWCFPIRILGEQSEQSKALVVFLVQKSAYQAAFERIIGELPGTLSLYYGKELLFQKGDETGDEVLRSDIIITSADAFSLTLIPHRLDAYRYAASHSKRTLIFCALIAFMLAAGVTIAVQNWRPIRRVYNKQKMPQQRGVNELEALERVLDRYAFEHKCDTLKISEQLRILRKKVLQLILSGKKSNLQAPVLDELGIALPHECFFTMAIISASGVVQTENTLLRVVSRCTTPAYCCYAASSAEGDMVEVLFNTEDPALRSEAAERLISLCAEENLRVVCGISSCTGDPGRLNFCMVEAVSALNTAGENQLMYYEDIHTRSDVFAEQNLKLNQLNELIRSGDEIRAQQQLDELIECIRQCTSSIPLQLYSCVRVLNILIQQARQFNLNFPPDQIGWLYLSTSIENFHDGIVEIVYESCDAALRQKNAESDDYSKRIIAFVEEHYLDYAMSLDLLSDHFSISSAQVSRLFKSATGESFKDFMIRKRILYARHLLQSENIPVAELCTRVGYTNVSHFIKVFKAQTGLTPAAWRKTIYENEKTP